MSKELKKKPGDMARARKIHLQNQERRDAIAKLRNGESIEIWAHYECGSAKVKVIPGAPDEQELALVICGKRLRVMLYIDRDGWKFYDSYRTAFLPDKQVIGTVTEILEVKNASKTLIGREDYVHPYHKS